VYTVTYMFRKGNFACIISPQKYEPKEWTIERGYFVASQKPTNQKEYNLAVSYSNIFVNSKFTKSIYSNEVILQLNKMLNSK